MRMLSDVVIRMAVQPLLRLSYQSPGETFAVNVLGTVRLPDASGALPASAAPAWSPVCLVLGGDPAIR
jgi:nucleoside-diphosphate-sugar epimerase